jgi:hypothetical protein
MAIEAPYGKYGKTNFKIAIFFCIGAAIVFAYDGYLSKYEWSFRHGFYEEHVKDGVPDGDMVFNQKSPFVFACLAVILTAWLHTRKNIKLTADDNELVFSEKKKIPYDSIQKIDKTYFDSKGYFTITYKGTDGNEIDFRLSDRRYDNLAAVLEHLVAKIS